MGEPLKIGVLVSGGGSNLQAVMDACERGAIDGKVLFVGADNRRAGGLQRAEKCGIPTFVVEYASVIEAAQKESAQLQVPQDFYEAEIRSKLPKQYGSRDETRLSLYLKSRAVAEARLLKKMDAFAFDLLVLAGFMRTLTPYFIDKVNISPDTPRIMNIHPALLPAFPGVDGYGDTFRYGCKIGGCTVHFIDYGEDSGPIIGQAAFDIEETDDIDAIRQKGLKLEWELYPKCIQLFAQGRLKTERTSYFLPGGQRVERTVVRILTRGKNEVSA